MVVDDIEDDGDAARMCGVDKTPQPVRTAVTFLDGEDIGRVVAPRNIGRKFVGRKQLDRIDAKVSEIIEAANDGVEVPPSVAATGIESETPDVQFVDDEFVPS